MRAILYNSCKELVSLEDELTVCATIPVPLSIRGNLFDYAITPGDG